MKNKILILSLFLVGLPFTSCASQNTSQTNQDYYIVTFNYNHATNSQTYISSVVTKDGVLDEPAEPNIENAVFEGWYSNKDCSKKYMRFGLAIDSNFTLYAKWSKYEDLDDVEKINKFQTKLSSYSKDATTTIIEKEGIVGYPGVVSGEDGVFGIKEENYYTRYKDITTLDYYSYDESGEKTLFGQEQYYYSTGTGGKFYDIYVDLEDETQNETKTSTFKQDKIESFLSIDFINIYGGIGRSIASIIEAGTYSEEDFAYSFNFNYTSLSNHDTYTYTEGYYVANYSDQIGEYVEQQYTREYGLVFENGKLSSCNIHYEYYMAVGGEIYYYIIENSVSSFYYSGEFQEFTGTRLTPSA